MLRQRPNMICDKMKNNIEGNKGKELKTLHLPEGIKAALIDMDGVLYNSMPHHAKAWHQMFSEQGITTDPDEFYLYEGMTGGDTIDLIFRRELKRGASEKERKNLYERKAELFVESGKKEALQGAADMLFQLKAMGLKTVLVTGSAQGSLLDSLDVDYPGYFPKERRVTALDVSNGKPHPEPYLKGTQKAGVSPAEALVVENAPLGVRAGKAAGCFTVAVTTGPIPREEFEKEGADIIFASMEDFAEWLGHQRFRRIEEELLHLSKEMKPATVTVVTDETVEKAVLPYLKDSEVLKNASLAVIGAGEENKNMNSVASIWNVLEETGATRKSLVINIGGGMVTDIGGFAAATFKRGIDFINVPTTLLGAVDAATGGKTGVNFNGLKNEIGAFRLPRAVILSTAPFASLDSRDLLSGYAEMVKTAFIADENLYKELLNPEKVLLSPALLEKLVGRCVEIKEEVVSMDPEEKGLRKILNFGHTAGHAFESLSFIRNYDLTHGEAVAHGMLVELILSHLVKGFESNDMYRYANEILKPYYRSAGVSCDDIPQLMELMAHDKKNAVAGSPNFTLLMSVGNPEFNCYPSLEDIKAALEIYIDLTA